MTERGDERTINSRELAEALGGSPGRYNALSKAGEIPFTTHGKRFFFNADEVARIVLEKGLKIQGFTGTAPEPSETDKQVDRIETEACERGKRAVLEYLQTGLQGAQTQGNVLLQIALHRKLAEALEELGAGEPEDGT